MVEWIVVIPKNRSLKACREIVKTAMQDEGIDNFKVLEVRGECCSFC